jgi:hypothetical protein
LPEEYWVDKKLDTMPPRQPHPSLFIATTPPTPVQPLRQTEIPNTMDPMVAFELYEKWGLPIDW